MTLCDKGLHKIVMEDKNHGDIQKLVNGRIQELNY